MARLGRYNPAEVTGVWGAISFLEGIAAGTFVTIDRIERSAKLVVGIDSEVAPVRANTFAGTIQFSLLSGSPTNALLAVQLRIWEESGIGIAPLTLRDASGFTLYTSPLALLEGWPTDTFATTESVRTWMLLCNPLIPFTGGNRAI